MFQFPSFPSYSYLFTVWYIRFTLCEFPHSDIRVSLTAYVFSRLFVVCHVLLRLLVPRHSPHALFILTFLALTPFVWQMAVGLTHLSTKFLRPMEVKNLCANLRRHYHIFMIFLFLGSLLNFIFLNVFFFLCIFQGSLALTPYIQALAKNRWW